MEHKPRPLKQNRAEELWKRIIESAPHALIMSNPRGEIVVANPQTEKLFGFTQEELIGQNIEMLVPERFRFRHVDYRKGFYKKAEARPMGAGRDLYGLRKDKTEVPIEIGLNPIDMPDGMYVLSSIVDITERKKAEEKFRIAVEAAPNAMIMVDDKGKIVLVNAQTERLFGYERAELIGQHIEMLIPDRFRKYHPHHRQSFYENPKMRAMGAGRDLFGLRKDRKELPIEIGLNPIRTGEGLFVLAAIVDITERKQIEKKMASLNEELERKVRERTALAERRAEKLRELASVLTITEQKERRRIARILHDHLQQILVAGKIRINRFSRQVDLSLRNEASQLEQLFQEAIEISRTLTMELSPPILRDGGLIASLEWLSRWMKEKHDLEVIIDADIDLKNPSEEIKIFLFQAVRELLFNVVKHAQTRRAFIVARAQNGHIRITVEDDGKGFDPKSLSAGSSHFGLLNIQDRLEMLGCHFAIESRPGQGSRFTIEAQISNGESSQKNPSGPAQQEPALKPAPTKVLVVDDHKILRQGLIYVLQTYKAIDIVGEASTGQEAIEKALTLHPDVIIMDVTMPGMNGIEATRRIKAMNPNIKIIGLSLHETEDMATTMVRAGASVYLNKSGPIDTLISSIQQLHVG